jgi:glycosyltransferase involved in cell wall biosynthesis
MPEIAGNAACLADPNDPASIASAILEACGREAHHLRQRGFHRAAQFTWGATAEQTLAVYRQVASLRRKRRQR